MRTNVFRGVLLAILCGWPAFGAAQQPTGLAAITSFDQSPYLKLNTVGGGFSSTDPSDGNADYNNFRYVDSNGDKVMLDLNGPGTVYRIWVTGFVAADYIKIYLDGSATPAVNMLMSTFFSGTTAPFLAPLVNNDKNSSGGLYCYLPIPFAKSIRITTNAPSAGATTEHFYYNIGFHTYTPDTSITTWTGQEDSSAARALWNQAGIDPKSTSGNTVESSATDAASDAS